MNIEKELEFNKQVLSAALKDNKISKVVFTYSGYGDSGNGVDLEEVEPAGVELHKLARGLETYKLTANWNEKILTKVKRTSLKDALEAFLEDIVDEYHSGYENNEGGGGTFTVYLEEQSENYTFHLDHYDNIVTEEHTDHTL